MHPLAALAKETIETYVKNGTVPETPAAAFPELPKKAGVFVSLKKSGALRGCIGTFEPAEESLAEEVIRNAVAAATQDPRFEAVEEDELDAIAYSVDVLAPPEKISSMNELDPRRYGVIVRQGGRRGLLLPDLEGVDTAAEQLRIAKMKAGIWTEEKLEIFRFTVERFR